jgi:hypothetical protein
MTQESNKKFEPPDGQTFADVAKAEAVRNDKEQKDQRDQQKEALAAAMKLADQRELVPEAREELQKFMEGQFKKQQEELSRKQQERGDRLELLYRGPPSERER